MTNTKTTNNRNDINIKIIGISLLVMILSLWHFSCKKIPLYAVEGATLIIAANKSYLKTGGDRAVITVIGFDADGYPLHDHTKVIFSASLGTVVPAEVEMMSGKAVVEFISGDLSGVAEIRARSGTVTAEPDPLQIVIGSAALETLTISANPSTFKAGGGRARIQAFAFDAGGNLLPNIPVVLTASSGTFDNPSSVYITNNLGMVEDFLHVTETTTVKAESGDKTAEVEIQVEEETENQPPTAEFTYSPSSPEKGEKVHFNASLSSDPDGTIVSWDWDFGDGKTGTGETITHKFKWEGDTSRTFTVVLKVTDDKGGEGVTSKSITVVVESESENQLPNARFSYSPASPQKGETIYFNASSSTDSDGTIVSYQWDFGDGSANSGKTVTHVYDWENGGSKTFTVILTVTDDRGGTAVTSQAVTVISGDVENQPPTADFIYSPTSPLKGETIHFNGSLSSDPDGTIVSWDWDFGDGTAGTGEKLDHAYNWNGSGNKTFTVVLTVTDNQGASAITSKTVTVTGEEENQSPSANFTYSPTNPQKDETIFFNGGLSSDPDGTIVSWQWNFGDGNTASGQNVNHAYNWTEPGNKTFVVELKVTDNEGAQDSIFVNITVVE